MGGGGESTDKGLRREWKPFCSDCCSVQTENMAPLLTGLYTRTHVYWVDAGGLRVQSPRCGCAIVLHRQRHCGFSLGLCSNVCIWVVVWQHHGHSWRWSVPLSCRYPTTKAVYSVWKACRSQAVHKAKTVLVTDLKWLTNIRLSSWAQHITQVPRLETFFFFLCKITGKKIRKCCRITCCR